MTTRILLAEDNDPLAQMLQTFLAAQGFAVLPAKTGTAALQLLASADVDLLILDLKLPELSGVEVLQKLRKSPRWATLPVIIMTGVYKGEKYAQGARKLGVSRYLEKPFSRQAFLHAVRSTLAEIREQTAAPKLLDLIIDLHHKRKSGLLTLPQGIQVCFIHGEPYSFVSRGKEEFPAFLVSRGKISADDLKLFVGNDEERLFFTQAGLLTYEDLVDESRLFLAETLMDSLAEEAAAAFSEGDSAAEFPLVPLSVPRLVYQAGRRNSGLFSGDSFLARFGSCYPSRTRHFFRHANLLTMRKEEIELLELVDSRRSLDEIVAAAGGRNEAAGFFASLRAMGMIAFNATPLPEERPDFPQQNLFNRPIEELQTPEEHAVGFDDVVEEVSSSVELVVGTEGMAAPLSSAEINFEQAVQREYAAIKDKNYYEIFGITRNSFSFNALKEAYFAKTRQYSPEKFMELSGSTMTIAQEILAHYANAYNTLSSVVAKERYDEMLNADISLGIDGKQDDKLQARIQFQSGHVFLEMGEFDNAEKALQEAYTLEPDNARHCALLAWAIYRNPANKSSRASQEKAKMLLAKSLQIEKCAEAFALRGWMLLDEGREGLAEGEFQKALRINPRDTNARNGLQQIATKREVEKKGLFRRMFS
jgi:CheY-like chemotaxis protein